jgi:6-pyruvoyltetrahydropterin/6-carboxytetrahydropterin synthase
MRCRLSRDFTFEAAHYLPAVPDGHKCRRVHGHSYRVSVSVEGEIDARLGWVVDFAAIEEAVAPLVAQLDHRLLNDIDGLANPTSEHLAIWMWQRVRPGLPGIEEITVAETPDSRCSYRGK